LDGFSGNYLTTKAGTAGKETAVLNCLCCSNTPPTPVPPPPTPVTVDAGVSGAGTDAGK